jgi:type II secretory pathway component PulC
MSDLKPEDFPSLADFYNHLEIITAAKEARVNENSENWEKANARTKWELIKRRNYVGFNKNNPSVGKESEEDSWKIVLSELQKEKKPE